jgi:hypothetical protein
LYILLLSSEFIILIGVPLSGLALPLDSTNKSN